MFYVYVLFSQRLNKRYVGSSHTVHDSMKEHNTGKSKFTKAGIPWKLIYWESFQSNQEARQREVFLKSGVGRKLLDKIVKKSTLEF